MSWNQATDCFGVQDRRDPDPALARRSQRSMRLRGLRLGLPQETRSRFLVRQQPRRGPRPLCPEWRQK